MVAYAYEKGLLFRAAASKHGIVLKTADMQRDIDALKAARSGEAVLKSVEVWRSPWSPTDEIWLVKTTAKAATAPSPKPSGVVPPPALEADVSLDDLGL